GCWLRAVATYDVFPEFSAKVRRLFYNPLGILILAALVALLCGLFLHAQGFVLGGGVLTVIVLGVTWPWMGLRGLHGAISFGIPRTSEGEKVEVSLTLRNRLPWAAWGLAVRGGFSEPGTEEGVEPPAVSLAVAPRRHTLRCRWSFVPDRRGVFPLQASHLTTG